MMYSVLRKFKLVPIFLGFLSMVSQTAHSQAFVDRFFVTGLASGQFAAPIVFSIERDATGSMLVGGNFTARFNTTTVSRGVARIDGLGKVDPSFTPNISTGSVRKVIPLSNGQILVAGDFSTANGSNTGAVVRLNSNGSLDSSFATHPTGIALDMALQSDGKIVVAGTYPAVNGFTTGTTFLYRLNVNGTLDQSFNQNFAGNTNDEVRKLAVLEDDSIIAVGRFTSMNGQSRGRVAKLTRNGNLVIDAFNDSLANGNVEAVAVQSDGRILIGGAFSSVNGVSSQRIARLDSNGARDPSFTPSNAINNFIGVIELTSDGKIYVGGNFSTLGGPIANQRLGRLLSDGTADPDFVANANNIIWAIRSNPNGFVDVGGAANIVSNQQSFGINRFDANAKDDSSFTLQTGTDTAVQSIAVVPDQNTVWFGGLFSQVGSKNNKWLSRHTNSGDHVSNFVFNPGNLGGPGVLSIAATFDNSLIAVGSFSGSAQRIIKVSPTGGVDASFSASANDDVLSVTTQPDGKVLISGTFGIVSSQSRARVARLNADGSLDTGFVPPATLSGFARAILVQDDGKIVVAGRLFIGSRRAAVLRLNADGSEDTSFNSGGVTAGKDVFALARQADGKYLIGGNFTDVNGTPANILARLNADGSLDTTFSGPNFSNSGRSVRAISVRSDGSIFVGGTFNNASFTRLAVLEPDGSVDTRYNFSGAITGPVFALVEQFNGKSIVAGNFESTSGTQGVDRDRIARIGTAFSYENIELSLDDSRKDLILTQAGFSPVLNWATLESSSDGVTWSSVGVGQRQNANIVFKDVGLAEEELRYFRISGNAGGAPSSGSLYRYVFQVFRGVDPEEGCDFYVVRVKSGGSVSFCL